jgi:hypothetical protein
VRANQATNKNLSIPKRAALGLAAGGISLLATLFGSPLVNIGGSGSHADTPTVVQQCIVINSYHTPDQR